MFYIEADKITFNGKTVAQLAPLSLATRRDLEETLLDFTTADDFEDEHEAALKAEYDYGFDAGRKDGAQDAENKLADDREQIEADAFAKGHAQGLLDGQFAADAKRVEGLLLALQEIHNAMQPLWLGFAVEGQFKRRTAKVGETKHAAQSACAAAHRAINAYRQC